MAPILAKLMILLNNFIPCFKQKRTFRYLIAFFKGFVLNGRKTVTGIFTLSEADGHWTNLYRFLKTYKWKTDRLCAKLCSLIIEKTESFAGERKLTRENAFAAIDQTFAEKTGKKFDGADIFFDHTSERNILGHCIFMQGILVPVPASGWTCIPVEASLYVREKTINEQNLKIEYRKMIPVAVEMAKNLAKIVTKPLTIVADAFFYKKSFFKTLHDDGVSVVTRCRSDAVAYRPAPKPAKKKRGRPRKFGEKIKLRETVKTGPLSKMEIKHKGKLKTIEYVLLDLLISGFAHPIRYLVIDNIPTPVILATTNLTLSASEILEIYRARFQIEFCFRDMKQHVGLTQYQIRRLEAIEKFLNLAILVYSLLKIEFFTNNAFQEMVSKNLDLPWRKKRSNFSFEQVLETVRLEIRFQRFFDTYTNGKTQENIPPVVNNTARKYALKC